MKTLGQRFSVVVVALALSGCPWNYDDSETAYQALVKCAANRLQPKDNILYFGPTSVPIGTIYSGSNGGYDTIWRGTRITGEPPKVDMVEQPSYGKCTYNGKNSIDLKAAFSLATRPLPASLEVDADLKNARVISMTADQFGWQTLYKGQYNEELTKSGSIQQDVNQNERFASVALLRVKNYNVTLDVSNANTAGLKAKLKDGPLPKNLVGDLGAEGSITWKNESQLVLTISQETTVGGVLRPFAKGQVQSGASEEKIFADSVGAPGATVQLRPERR